MNLNATCSRDVMLYIDKHMEDVEGSPIKKATIDLGALPKELSEYYSPEEVLFHIHQCENSKFISGVSYHDTHDPGAGSVSIYRVTDKGYDFLYTLKRDKKTQKSALKLIHGLFHKEDSL